MRRHFSHCPSCLCFSTHPRAQHLEMKRKKVDSPEMSESKDPIELPVALDASSLEVNSGVVVAGGSEVPVSNAPLGSSSNLPRVADLSLDPQFVYFLPDELLLKVFACIWRPDECKDAARVCKQWCTLQCLQSLKKRSGHEAGHYPCTGSKKAKQLGNGTLCNGTSGSLQITKVESEWRLSMDLLKCCRRHTKTLEIKDCTRISEGGYQLIANFASNLKVLRLESSTSMDETSFNVILGRCESLLYLHLSSVPKLTLKKIEEIPRLRKLCVNGCASVTPTTVLSILEGCPTLRSLSLSAMGVPLESDEIKLAEGPPLRLQTLELLNSEGVTDAFLQALAGRFSNLRTLNLSDCRLLSDDGLTVAIASCRLQRLAVTSCPSVSDGSASALASSALNLQDISLAGTNVSNDGLQALMGSAAIVSKLRNLSVAGCKRVTFEGLQQLVSRQEHLVSFKSLDIQSCPEVSIVQVEALRNSLRSSPKKIPWKIVYEGKT